MCGVHIGPSTRSSVSKNVAAVHQHHIICCIVWHIEDFLETTVALFGIVLGHAGQHLVIV